ncbi:MAG: RNA methyltransferase [Rhodospirillales bacterium]|nr:RNA methyltransferase [Rhodospirillales bacterium]
MTEKKKPRRLPKSSAKAAQDAPAIILINPQLGENIGMSARAMLNNALGDLRLVAPVHGWPNENAIKPSAGAEVILDAVRVFETTPAALSDLSHVYATTARDRDMTKRVLSARAAAQEMRGVIAAGGRPGVIFGREAWGLNNDDVALADTLVTIPMNPAFSSLNLAQAVLLIGYEWFQSGDLTPAIDERIPKHTRLADKAELVGMFEHLEAELDDCGFLRPPEKRPAMVRNIRNMFQRANMTEQEVRTFRGIISGLIRKHER